MTAPRTPLAALAVALAAVAAYLALARWAAGDLLALAHEVGREESLAQRLAAAQRFSEGKRRATAELIAGRITLRQAAERFRELSAPVRQGDGQDGVAPFPVAAGEEVVWRNVLLWVENELYHRRDGHAAAVLSRWRAEYRERFGHGPGPLP